MTAVSRHIGTCLMICAGLASCGGEGDGSAGEPPVNVDYSALRIADGSEEPLVYASRDDDVLRPLRNGARLMLAGGVFALPTTGLTPAASTPGPHSDTTVQVEGVDEADAVKYDGQYIYTARRALAATSSTTAQLARNVISVARTNPAVAGVELLSNYVLDGEQSADPLLYQVQPNPPSGANAAEYLVAVSQNYHGWLLPQVPLSGLVVQPDRTTLQLLDVRDPGHLSQAWKLELDGWLRASRMIGDTLYLVSSYRPRIRDLVLPADTLEKREANERRILASGAAELLPGYAENDGPRRRMVDGCLITRQLGAHEAYTDLLVIAAINVRTRRVTDVNCLSTNVNGVYMSRQSLYVAGTASGPTETRIVTVLHKFALESGGISYRATGAAPGTVSWTNPSYFMDEHAGNLRIVTTDNAVHRLTVLREASGGRLLPISTLPNAAQPAPIGKPGEAVYAVRFMGERAYVVTFRVTDPLYVIDLANPAAPAVAGELEIPGFSTYLRPLGPGTPQLLLTVGQAVTADGRRAGVKVQLFDVRDIAHPHEVASEVFGQPGTWSDALDDPHALTFLSLADGGVRERMALPIHVFDSPHPEEPGRFTWTYSGLHLLEIGESEAGAPELRFQGVIRMEERGSETPNPTYAAPNRGVLHGDSVFSIQGERIRSSLWQNVPSS